ncbi:MAG: 23S rRNA (adenine(2503)-C(2))-methyltransferase RlmN [Candidatus Cloacimonadota bacterium]|nr:23S rRNA (adenine(2503)-C(2))-methyltransferase RlmN [Candidatus Cloacimonadota bacterium]
MKNDLISFSKKELAELMAQFDQKSYRAEQLFRAIHQNQIGSFDKITVFSKKLREELSEKYVIGNSKILKRYNSKIDETKKFLLLLSDNNIIESVLMKYKYGYSQCLSTQVGCKMGCSFCASTKGGLVRNLSSGEILNQIYLVQKNLGIKISNIVLMGSGEPLDNYDNVLKFLKLIHDPDGQNIGYRHITLSTVGIPEQIYRLAKEGLPITLTVSLHSPFDSEREKIVPIARKYPLNEILQACKYYRTKTGRRISFEYALIRDENDSEAEATELAKILNGIMSHVNLIFLNPIREKGYEASTEKTSKVFISILEKKGIEVTIRRKMGRDIQAACGQLRNDYLNEQQDL